MTKKSINIQVKSGLEARPTAVLVQVASQYESTIYLESEGRKVNAKSIMGMMSLGLTYGEELVIIADGVDETEAVSNLETLLTGEEICLA